MQKETIVPVVLCGGSGTRLWPLSRSIQPKQLLPLVNEQSMLQNTLQRAQSVTQHANPVVICNQEYRFIVAEQLREAGFAKAHIFLEPEGRNTAPAVTIVALHAFQHYQDPLLLVLPSDHVIDDTQELSKAIDKAIQLANEGHLVTFGVKPTKAETGYGYILQGESLNDHGYKVEQFIEKPCTEKAREYVDAGRYFWNSGMFLFRASLFLEAIEKFGPDILDICKQASLNMAIDQDYFRLSDQFLNARNESIDFAVMEKAHNIAMVPLESSWSDVGSWDVLWQLSQKDVDGNVLKGKVYVDRVSDSYLRAEKRLLAVVGLSNIAVVETPDAVLVTHKSHCQDVKALVSALKVRKNEEVNVHNRVLRPWGYYDLLSSHENYKIKHIFVKAGAKLSLQLHRHRSEHWVVIKGTAVVTRGDEIFEVNENESVYIPANVKHRIENNTAYPLFLIEVQTGEHLSEEDIVRFEDMYGREAVVLM